MKHPYRAYALITSVYLGFHGGFVALARSKGRELSQRLSLLDLVTLGLATFRLSRLAAWDEVTSFLRLPFVKHGPEDKVEGKEQEPRGRGLVRALGELITCTTCIGTWIAAGLMYALYLVPSLARPLISILAAAGLSQFVDGLVSLVYSARDRLGQ
ncbi:MAG: DUF1360 domain-containing protein [Chloroflexota bacterium]|nr:DUF1360 domain-containing protein [Chloroflexota bacterium]